jgi:hypothetical protein
MGTSYGASSLVVGESNKNKKFLRADLVQIGFIQPYHF